MNELGNWATLSSQGIVGQIWELFSGLSKVFGAVKDLIGLI